MPIPSFEFANTMDVGDVLVLLRDRVRIERKRLGYTQAEFAQICGISLRTFKRFELGASGSIEVLIRIAQAFGRGPGLDMLFPAQLAVLKPRGIDAAMMSIRSKLDDRVVRGEAKSETSLG